MSPRWIDARDLKTGDWFMRDDGCPARILERTENEDSPYSVVMKIARLDPNNVEVEHPVAMTYRPQKRVVRIA